MNQSLLSPLPEELLGTQEANLVYEEQLGCMLHRDIVVPLLELADAARQAGFELRVASSYRSFERQLLIWNNKASGVRPVLDEIGTPIDMTPLSDTEKVYAILRWSALPGASRHHWGTDIDVFDGAALPPDYQVQLTQEETEGSGLFAPFHRWLTQALQTNPRGFFRPYVAGIGSIAPEPWHLSYAPVANRYAAAFTEALLREKILATDIALKDAIVANLGDIVAKYIAPYCP